MRHNNICGLFHSTYYGLQIFPLFFSWFVSLLPIKWQKQDIRLIFKPTLKTVKMCIKKCFIFCQEWVISKHSMLSYLWLVSSTIMVEIRVELLITLILQFKLPWPSSTYWGWLSIKHRSNWKNNETRDQTKNIKPKQQYILKDLSVISFFDFITTCSTLTCTCISTEHIHTWS